MIKKLAVLAGLLVMNCNAQSYYFTAGGSSVTNTGYSDFVLEYHYSNIFVTNWVKTNLFRYVGTNKYKFEAYLETVTIGSTNWIVITTNRATKIKIRYDMICTCGSTMKFTDVANSQPPQYLHTCTNCFRTKLSRDVYPYNEWK